MSSRKLLRDLLISQPIFQQVLVKGSINRYVGIRQFGVFNEFSQKIKGEVDRNQEFQLTVKELKEKAEGLKGLKEDIKTRTKQTTEQLYKQVDGVWTEAEATGKKVYANVEEKISATKDEMQGHPLFKRFNGMVEPVVTKIQETAEDIHERWETSDRPFIHKMQDLFETVFGDSPAAMSFKAIRSRDPSFSLPEFVGNEVQEVIRPVLEAFFKGDIEVLKKYCTNEVIERCKAEHQAFDSQGIIFDNNILHISDVEVRETKMVGESSIIILAFHTQQVYCIRDKLGSIQEGGKDTIHTVHYAWAMQQVEAEELGEGAIFPIWRLREMQQFNVATLI